MRRRNLMSLDRSKRMTASEAIIARIKKSRAMAGGRRSAIFRDDFDGNIYKPDYGLHLIDIILYLAGDKDPDCPKGQETYTFTYFMHNTGPAKTQVICPTMYKKPCPICEMLSTLTKGVKEDEKIYQLYKMKKRNLYNVVVHDSKEERRKGVQVFDESDWYFESNLRAIAIQAAREGGEEKIVDFTDEEKGKSIQFENIKKSSKDSFDIWKGHSFQDRDYKIDDKIKKQVYCLDQIVKVLSYEEIKSILDGSLPGAADYNYEDDNQSSNSSTSQDTEEVDFQAVMNKVLSEAEDADDLEDISDDHKLEEYGFEGIDTDNDFDSEKEKIIAFLAKMMKPASNATSSENSGFDKEEILSKIKAAEDHNKLDDIVDDYNLDDLGFEDIDDDKDFSEERKRLKKWVKSYTPVSNEEANYIDIDKEKVLSKIKKAKTIEKLQKIIDKFNLSQIYKDFDSSNDILKERVKLKKFIKAYGSDSKVEQKKEITVDDINKMDFQTLLDFAKENYSHRVDIDYYDDEDDLEELREDVLKACDDIPF